MPSDSQPTQGRPLRVESSLTLSVSLPGRASVDGRLGSDGQRLTLETADPATFLAAGLGSTKVVGADRGVVKVLAERLSEGGLTLTLSGPQGAVGSVGAGVHSRLGRLVTGSSKVSPGALSSLVPVLWAVAGHSGHRRRIIGGSALAAIAGLVAAGRLASRS